MLHNRQTLCQQDELYRESRRSSKPAMLGLEGIIHVQGLRKTLAQIDNHTDQKNKWNGRIAANRTNFYCSIHYRFYCHLACYYDPISLEVQSGD